jgi:hypothetical protein
LRGKLAKQCWSELVAVQARYRELTNHDGRLGQILRLISEEIMELAS